VLYRVACCTELVPCPIEAWNWLDLNWLDFPLSRGPGGLAVPSFSDGGQAATEPARLLLRCEVLLQTLALNSVSVRGGQKERRGECIPCIRLCQVKYATLTHTKGRVTLCGILDGCQTANRIAVPLPELKR